MKIICSKTSLLKGVNIVLKAVPVWIFWNVFILTLKMDP